MRMPEFVDTYCADIKAMYSHRTQVEDDYDLPYDDIIEDDSGQKMKVVYCNGKAIPVADIITSDRDDFAVLYPDFACRELYDNYIESLVIIEGEEVVNHIKRAMRREQERVAAFKQDTDISKSFW